MAVNSTIKRKTASGFEEIHPKTNTNQVEGLATLLSGITIDSIDDIADVNVPSPTDGYVLTWDNATSKWIAAEGGGGAVDSVNGQTGVVVLTASDVGAYTTSQTDTLLSGKLSTTGKAADSELLDGIDSSSFLRSNTSDGFDRIFQNATGVPVNNLGTPSITEMALIEEQFNNKTAFYTISNLKFYTSTDNSTWTEITFSDQEKRRFLGGDTSSGINIPNTTPYFRIEIANNGNYVYLNALYMYWSSNSHSTKVKIRVQRGDGVWFQHTNSDVNVSSWPGHLYLPFGTIPFHPSTTSTGHYRTIHIDFIPTWQTSNPTYSGNAINLYKLQLWGGYPAGRRRIYSIDENQNVNFPANLTLSGTVDGVDIAAFKTAYDSHTHAYIPTSEKGAASGVATLDSNGFIPADQLGKYIQGGLRLRGTLADSNNTNTIYNILYGFTQDATFNTAAGASTSEYEEFVGNVYVAIENTTLQAGSTLTGHAYTIQAPGDEGDSTLPIDLEPGDMLVVVGYSYPSSVHTWQFAIINNNDPRFLLKSGDTMSGALNAYGGINMNNTNISGVNQISINDPGEGILWQGTTNVNQYVIDDANDNIMNFSNLAEMQINGSKVFHDGYHPNADTLTTARNIALTGAVTGNADFDGSGNISIATTHTADPTITLTGAVTGSGTMTNLGNVSIATTATADPTLTINGDASGSATFTNLGNATLTLTIADDSHNHTIANVDGLQTALDGKQAAGSYAAATHNHSASEIVTGELNTARMGSGTATAGYVLKSDGDGTASWQVDSNTTYNLGSFGVTATSTELNVLDGITATTTELNYTDGVTSNIQTQLNGKASTSHTHALNDLSDVSAASPSSGQVLKWNGLAWAPAADNNTTYSLGSFGVTATAAELNALDGITATVTELNYTDGVTSNIQTQLNGKAASSHSHSADVIGVGGISFIGKSTSGAGSTSELSVATAQTMLGLGSAAYTASTAYAAASHNHSATQITSGTISTARLGSGTASSSTYLRGDSTWATIPSGGISGDDVEWAYVGKSTDSSANTSITVDTSDGISYDWANYDYKFVYQGSTTAEDTSAITIFFDGDTSTSGKYSWQYHLIQQTAETTESSTFVGDAIAIGNISTGLAISSYSTLGFGTDVTLEFVVRRSLTTGSGLYAFLVQGHGHAHYWPTTQTLTTAADGMAQSRFVGSFRQDAAITSVTVNHGITVGGTDVNIVRVYRRRKT